jgi:hypothetical protein
LHDFDYERHPTPRSIRLSACANWSGWAGRGDAHGDSGPRAVLRRAARDASGKALFACDELAGFLTACALVKPTKAIADVEVAGVRKKMKDKAFARGVNREDMMQGAAELGVDLDAHIAFCMEAMKSGFFALSSATISAAASRALSAWSGGKLMAPTRAWPPPP